MSQKLWVLQQIPHTTDLVAPGRLIVDRKNPTIFFDPVNLPVQQPAKRKIIADVNAVTVENPTSALEREHSSKISASIASFASNWLRGSGGSASTIAASKSTRYLLLQPEDWLARICKRPETRTWLEEQIRVHRRRVWLITGILTLSDTQITVEEQKSFSLGAGATLSVLLPAGVPLPTPLDPGVEAEIETSRGTHHGAKVPDERVFQVQYWEVKLNGKRQSDVPIDFLRLKSKARWVQTIQFRSGSADDEGEALEATLEQVEGGDNATEDAELAILGG